MKPLPTTRRVFSWFCVYHDEASTKWQKLAHISFTSIVFVFLITASISSIGYIFKNISISLEDSLYAVPQISAVVIIKYSLIAMYFSRDEFHGIFYNLSDIYKKCNVLQKSFKTLRVDPSFKKYYLMLDARMDSSKYLEKANNKSERFWPIYFKFIMVPFMMSSAVVSIVTVLFQWKVHGEFDTQHLFHAFRFL